MKSFTKAVTTLSTLTMLKNNKRVFQKLLGCNSKLDTKNNASNFSISIDGEFLSASLFRKRRIIGQDFEMF